MRYERKYGKVKRVCSLATGKVHLVPIRHIIEESLSGLDLTMFPAVEPTLEEAQNMEAAMLLAAGVRPVIENGVKGIRIGDTFIPVQAPPDGDYFMVCVAVAERPAIMPGSRQMTCHDCGQAVWVAPSTQQLFAEGKHPCLLCNTCAEKRMRAE